jgi:hypothetical protein
MLLSTVAYIGDILQRFKRTCIQNENKENNECFSAHAGEPGRVAEVVECQWSEPACTVHIYMCMHSIYIL